MRAPTRGAPTSVLGRRAGHVIEELLQGAIAQRVCLDHSLLRLIVEPYFFLRAFGLAQVSGYICHAVVSLDGVRSETDTRLHLVSASCHCLSHSRAWPKPQRAVAFA